MCIDYTYLNKVCLKDAYSLLSICGLVDGASGHKMLSFLDAYLDYNQILMFASIRIKGPSLLTRPTTGTRSCPLG